MRRNNDAGFILPLAVLLVLILTISGTGFMQHDYLERRMATNNVDNHGAFYVANAGIERARVTFKVPIVSGSPSWTTVLQDAALADPTPNAGCPASNPTCLCPDLTRGCVIPPFGATVAAPDLPFDGTFDDGAYIVRAFNDNAEVGTTDGNGILRLRALGTVLGEQKILEVTVLAVSAVDLMNCQGNYTDPCPDSISGDPDLKPSDGRKPSSHPQLPSLDLPLTDPNSDYRNDSFFTFWNPGHSAYPCTAPLPGPLTFDASNPLVDNTFYCVDGDVVIQNTGVNNKIVIFSTEDVDILAGVTLTNAVIIALGEVRLNGDLDIHAPLPYPAILSNGAVHADGAVDIFGAIYSTGAIDLNPASLHGVVIGDSVAIQGDPSTLYTDDGNAAYYKFLPGFTYPNALKTTTTVNGTWREIQ